jgi:hypothetical protein
MSWRHLHLQMLLIASYLWPRGGTWNGERVGRPLFVPIVYVERRTSKIMGRGCRPRCSAHTWSVSASTCAAIVQHKYPHVLRNKNKRQSKGTLSHPLQKNWLTCPYSKGLYWKNRHSIRFYEAEPCIQGRVPPSTEIRYAAESVLCAFPTTKKL